MTIAEMVISSVIYIFTALLVLRRPTYPTPNRRRER